MTSEVGVCPSCGERQRRERSDDANGVRLECQACKQTTWSGSWKWLSLDASGEITEVACPGCGKKSLALKERTYLDCGLCGLTVLCRRCSNCSEPFAADSRSDRATCPSCGFGQRFSKAPKASIIEVSGSTGWVLNIQDPLRNLSIPNHAGLNEALKTNGIDGDGFIDDPTWRLLSGTILDIEGVSGLAKGSVDLLFFGGVLHVLIEGHQKFISVPLASLTEFQFAGRGRHSTSADFEVVGGGFGLGGAAKGMAEAWGINTVIQLLTSRTAVESLVHLAWSPGRLTVLNESIPPEQLAHSFRDIVHELNSRGRSPERATETDSPAESLSQQLATLAKLWKEGALSESEFEAAKGKLLG